MGLRTSVFAVVVALSLALAGCGSGSDESLGLESVSEGQRTLYQEALDAGGELTVFTAVSGTAELDMLAEKFNVQFPGIAVQFITGTGDKVQERLLTEKRAGLNNADVVALGGIDPFVQIDEAGFLGEFTPEDADLYTYEAKAYLAGKAYAFGDIQMGACYNPTNLTDEEVALLHTFDGWTDPRFRDRAAIVSPDGFGYRRGLSYWVFEDPALGQDWLTALADHHPTVYNTAGTAAPQVIAGEHDVLFNALTVYAVRAAREGAPLRCITGEYAPTYPFSVGLVDNAPHAAAGKLFINWLLSEEGQVAVQETFGYQARREDYDAPPIVEEDWWQPAQGEQIRFVDEQVVNDNYVQLRDVFQSQFGGPQG